MKRNGIRRRLNYAIFRAAGVRGQIASLLELYRRQGFPTAELETALFEMEQHLALVRGERGQAMRLAATGGQAKPRLLELMDA